MKVMVSDAVGGVRKYVDIDGSKTTVNQVLKGTGVISSLRNPRAFVNVHGYTLGADQYDETFESLGCPENTWVAIDRVDKDPWLYL